jgi:hypothetical protein
VAFGLELVFQRKVIFNDPVMHDHDIALAVAVRVSVFLSRTAMGGPTGVADAKAPIDGVELPLPDYEVCPLPGGSPDGYYRNTPPSLPNRIPGIRGA